MPSPEPNSAVEEVVEEVNNMMKHFYRPLSTKEIVACRMLMGTIALKLSKLELANEWNARHRTGLFYEILLERLGRTKRRGGTLDFDGLKAIIKRSYRSAVSE